MAFKDTFDPVPRPPYSYEASDKDSLLMRIAGTMSYRIYDADDNRIATCFDEGNARFIVAMLNRARPAP